jgi:hypothetical protein
MLSKHRSLALPLAALLIAMIAPVFADKGAHKVAIKGCEDWRNELYYYNSLRAKGGNKKQEKVWRRMRTKYLYILNVNHCGKHDKKSESESETE